MFRFPDEKSTPGRQSRLALPGRFWLWLSVFGLAGLAAGLMVWTPYKRRQQVVAEIHTAGGQVYFKADGPDWVEETFGRGASQIFDVAVAVDMSRGRANDRTLKRLVVFSSLRRLDLYGPGVTDQGIKHLNGLRELRLLSLINCPNVSRTAIDRLQQERPRLKIVRRGPAFLGIAGAAHPDGCRVLSVQRGTAAQTAGLHPGDIITVFAGKRVNNFESLAELIAEHNPGEQIAIDVKRRGEALTLKAVLGRWN